MLVLAVLLGIRIRIEDRLLASSFGDQFDDYGRTTRAYIPSLDGLTLFGCHSRGCHPYSLLGFVIFLAAHATGCVKALAQEDE